MYDRAPRLVPFERQVSILVRNKTYHPSELIGPNRRASAYSSSSTTNGLLVVAFRRGMIRDRCWCAVLCAAQLRSDLECRRHHVGARRIVDVALPRRAVVADQRQIALESFGQIRVADKVPVERDDNRAACRDNSRGTLTKAGDKRSLGEPWALLLLIFITSTQRSIGVDVLRSPAFGLKSARIRQISTMPPSTITVWPVM